MLKKIKFYKFVLIELIETLCSICDYLYIDGGRSHNPRANTMKDHFLTLKSILERLRKDYIK